MIKAIGCFCLIMLLVGLCFCIGDNLNSYHCIERSCPSDRYSDFAKPCQVTSCTIPDDSKISNQKFNLSIKSNHYQDCLVDTIRIDNQLSVDYYNKTCEELWRAGEP